MSSEPLANGLAPLRVAIVADLLEEGWPSMDLVAEMLTTEVPHAAPGAVSLTLLRAPFLRILPVAANGTRPTPERIVNRFWRYPQWLRRHAHAFDLFHVADHSYAHLVHVLPRDRTIVFCHDVDAFSALHGEGDRGSRLPRALTRRVASGLGAAARVLCISEATRAAVERHGLADPARVRVVPLGVHPSCTPRVDAEGDARVVSLLGPRRGAEILHVGSTISRKRLDVLLRVVAAVRRARPSARLVRVGGPMTDAQRDLARTLGLADAIVELPPIDRAALAAVYRRAAVTLLTSEREGFGLPIAEALACGTPVVATDIDACREAGGDAALYRSLDDVDGWAADVVRLIDEAADLPAARAERGRRGLARAAAFTWARCARSCVEVYSELAARSLAPRR